MLLGFVRLHITIHTPSNHRQLLPPVLTHSLLAPRRLTTSVPRELWGEALPRASPSLRGVGLHFHKAFAQSRKDSPGQRKCKSSWPGV